MKKHGKKYLEAIRDLDLDREYKLEEALELAKKANFAKFDPTLEIHMKLGVDIKKPEQNVRSTIILPHGTGKDIRVLAFVDEKNEKVAKDAGADHVGLEEFIEKINKGWLDFDVAVAIPETMPKIVKVAKILGGRGIMPNPKAGTVTSDIAKTIKEFKKGKIEFRSDSLGGIHIGIGKLSFDTDKLIANFNTLYKAILSSKPSSFKGVFVKSVSISSTMGPGIKIDVATIK